MTTFEEKHGRPKPPSIRAEGRYEYDKRHQVIPVYRSPLFGRWLVARPNVIGLVAFSTHAEAVAYAHKLASRKERS